MSDERNFFGLVNKFSNMGRIETSQAGYSAKTQTDWFAKEYSGIHYLSQSNRRRELDIFS